MSDGDQNPYVDPGPFGFVTIEDEQIATTLIEVDGCAKPEEWTAQKGTGTGGATSVWKGTKIAEAVKLKFRANDEASYAAQGDLYNKVRPKLGDKPPTVRIGNAVVNWGGIDRIALKVPAFPKWDAAKGAWDFEWEFTEIGPSQPANTGAADKAKPGFNLAPHDTESGQEMQKLLDEAKKL